ncbi:butyrophilin subfamily 3 member A2-like [Melanotaenia boesemani]|uniref:butyrophilin subfamily 3 member A2-like n=1 Tax=Melanotaenia boesemani TaxID=1250792 RepID=UPI001C03D55B|nr:butyrophilin subfamily 3 member A2-like [Melanotaenia boesemani]
MVGGDVVLPCHLKHPTDTGQVTVEWRRPDLTPRFVYVWHNMKEYLSDQNTAFKGRTSLSIDKMKQGDVSLKLSDLRYSDNGRYRCYISNERRENFVDLIVGAASSPGISLAGLDQSSSRVVLQCQSAGWNPEPELFWLDDEENLLSAGPAETVRGPDGLFTVSSRVTVEKRHNNSFMCRVQQKNINQTRETHIHVPDDFFYVPFDCTASISFNVVFCILAVLGLAAFIWKRRQSRSLKKKPDEQQQLLEELNRKKLAESRSKLEQGLRSLEQAIDALVDIKDELEKQSKKLIEQRNQAEKEAEENEMKIKAVDDEVKQKDGDKIVNKAQGYIKLKEIMLEGKHKLEEKMKDQQEFQVNTEILVKKACDVCKSMTEMKKELESVVDKIKKQMEEMETSS